MNVGIYKITHRDTNRVYIGQSRNLHKRQQAYKSSGGGGATTSVIKRAILKYGWDAFDYEPLIYCTENMLNTYEINAIKVYDCIAPNGFNLETGGGNYSVHEDTKQKLRQQRLGNQASEYTKHKMSKSQKKRWANSEATERQREVGRIYGACKPSDETKAKMSAKLRERGKANPESFANFKGRKHSAETKEKMRQAHLKRYAALRAAKEIT